MSVDSILLKEERVNMRKTMIDNMIHGGKRNFYIWIRNFYGTGDGQIGIFKYIVLLMAGGNIMATGNYIFTILSFIAYFFLCIIIGFCWYWFDFATMSTHQGNVMNSVFNKLLEKKNGKR